MTARRGAVRRHDDSARLRDAGIGDQEADLLEQPVRFEHDPVAQVGLFGLVDRVAGKEGDLAGLAEVFGEGVEAEDSVGRDELAESVNST